jgi:hypothetical protein
MIFFMQYLKIFQTSTDIRAICATHNNHSDLGIGANYDVEVKRVQITPDPIARGHPATFTISATTSTPYLYFFFHVILLLFFFIHLDLFFSLIQSFIDAGQALSEGKLLIDVSYP